MNSIFNDESWQENNKTLAFTHEFFINKIKY